MSTPSLIPGGFLTAVKTSPDKNKTEEPVVEPTTNTKVTDGSPQIIVTNPEDTGELVPSLEGLGMPKELDSNGVAQDGPRGDGCCKEEPPPLRRQVNADGSLTVDLYLTAYLWRYITPITKLAYSLRKGDVLNLHIMDVYSSTYYIRSLLNSLAVTEATINTFATQIRSMGAIMLWAIGDNRHATVVSAFHVQPASVCGYGRIGDAKSLMAHTELSMRRDLEFLQSIGLITEEEVNIMIDNQSSVVLHGKDLVQRVQMLKPAREVMAGILN